MSNELSYVEIIQPGIASIQDTGRFGYLSEGIPVAGFMDYRAAGFANMLVGNSVDNACIEWGMLPPKLKFKDAAVIALTGALVEVYLDGIQVSLYKSINVLKNSVLSFGRVKSGVYSYIAIQNGFQTKKVLESRSWFFGITSNQLFRKGMEIPFFKQNIITATKTRLVPLKHSQSILLLEAYPGPEFNLLTKKQQSLLLNSEYTISVNRNRMGIQLNEVFELHDFSLLSSPVLPGTVQWTPSGKLIILMKDAQTIGGYPRLLQLKNNEQGKLSAHNSNLKFNI